MSHCKWRMNYFLLFIILIIAVTIMVSVEAKGGRSGGRSGVRSSRSYRYARGTGSGSGGRGSRLEVWEIILIIVGVITGTLLLYFCVKSCSNDGKKLTNGDSNNSEDVNDELNNRENNETETFHQQTNFNSPIISNGNYEMTTNSNFNDVPPPSYEEAVKK